MEGLIPARGKSRELLDSAFLLAYAKRVGAQARWMMVVYALGGALVGFGVGSAFVAVSGFVAMLTGPRLNLAALFGQAEPAVTDVVLWGIPAFWIPLLVAFIGAVIWGARGMSKSDEMRFNAQMALHVLKLQELILQDKDRG